MNDTDQRNCRRPSAPTDRQTEVSTPIGEGDGFAFPYGQPEDGLTTGKPPRLRLPVQSILITQENNLTRTGKNSCRQPARIVDVDHADNPRSDRSLRI